MSFLIAFLNPILHGLSNTLDSHLSNNVFSRVRALVFFGALLNLIFLPIIFLIARPNLLDLRTLPFILLISLIETAYLFPYYKAVRKTDTSIVNALFSLGKVFVPILAFFVVKERLSAVQYMGFSIIMVSGILLVFDPKKLKLNGSFFLMGFVSFILAIEGILYKFIFESVSWGTGFFWVTLFSCAFSLSLFLHTSSRMKIKENFDSFRRNFKILFSQEILNWGGNMTETYVISALPITVVKGISASQPIFVLIYALLFAKLFPSAFKEEIDKKNLMKKTILFSGIILGTLLVM